MKAVNIINKIIYGLIAIMFLYIIGINLLMNRRDQYWAYYDFSVSKWILFFVAMAIVALILFFVSKLAKKEKADNKKYVKTYKKIFTKSNAGKKVTVK